MTPHIVLELFDKAHGRMRILVGGVIAVVDIKDALAHFNSTVREADAAGCRSIVVIVWRKGEAKEFGCFSTVEDIANALEARAVSS